MGSRDDLDWLIHLGPDGKWGASTVAGAPVVARQKGWSPSIDLWEAPDYFLIRAELSGVRPSQLELVYHPDRHSLLIRGMRQDTLLRGLDRIQPHVLEIDEGEFEREIELPTGSIDLTQVRTRFQSGMLSIVLPKKSEHTISVFIGETITLTTL